MPTPNTTPFWVITPPAELAAFPERMSVTRLQEVEKCPLSWSLKHSKYHWDHGTNEYPSRINQAALKGSVIHKALEIILTSASDYGCSSPDDPNMNDVLRHLGGWTSIITGCIDEVMKSYEDNPRVSMVLGYHTNRLKDDVPDIKLRVLLLLEDIRVRFREKKIAFAKRPAKTNLLPKSLPPGVYTELRLQSEEIGWTGIADLLILSESECQIIDYKTGEPSDEHGEQLKVYALLWKYDRELNPSGKLVDSLVLSYPNGDVDIEAPSEDGLELLFSQLTQRTESVKELATSNPPKAIPATETCSYCEVRQNCDSYWDHNTQLDLGEQSTKDNHYIDIELKISDETGRTWDSIVTASRDIPVGSRVNLRVNKDVIGFDLREGITVRVLGAYHDSGESRSGDRVPVTLGSTGEIFLVPVSQSD